MNACIFYKNQAIWLFLIKVVIVTVYEKGSIILKKNELAFAQLQQ